MLKAKSADESAHDKKVNEVNTEISSNEKSDIKRNAKEQFKVWYECKFLETWCRDFCDCSICSIKKIKCYTVLHSL